jgi:DNA-binding response OmpR family regulator
MDKSQPAPIKIILAEDEPTIAAAYKTGLSYHGFEVILAADGKEALLAIQKYRPDIVLLDVIMPHMTGLEVLEAMENDPELKKLPVIILSNLDQSSDTVRANDLGARAYLIKANLSLKELVEHIKAATHTDSV